MSSVFSVWNSDAVSLEALFRSDAYAATSALSIKALLFYSVRVLWLGRQLEHWHTGSMTRRATVLDAIEPMATVSMNGEDMSQLGVSAGDVITVQSRRGEVGIHVRRDDGTPRGVIFIPFAYFEAAANLITNPALDPFGKIPEFKYCAVKLAKGGQASQFMGYGTNDPEMNKAAIVS